MLLIFTTFDKTHEHEKLSILGYMITALQRNFQLNVLLRYFTLIKLNIKFYSG